MDPTSDSELDFLLVTAAEYMKLSSRKTIIIDIEFKKERNVINKIRFNKMKKI